MPQFLRKSSTESPDKSGKVEKFRKNCKELCLYAKIDDDNDKDKGVRRTITIKSSDKRKKALLNALSAYQQVLLLAKSGIDVCDSLHSMQWCLVEVIGDREDGQQIAEIFWEEAEKGIGSLSDDTWHSVGKQFSSQKPDPKRDLVFGCKMQIEGERSLSPMPQSSGSPSTRSVMDRFSRRNGVGTPKVHGGQKEASQLEKAQQILQQSNSVMDNISLIGEILSEIRDWQDHKFQTLKCQFDQQNGVFAVFNQRVVVKQADGTVTDKEKEELVRIGKEVVTKGEEALNYPSKSLLSMREQFLKNEQQIAAFLEQGFEQDQVDRDSFERFRNQLLRIRRRYELFCQSEELTSVGGVVNAIEKLRPLSEEVAAMHQQVSDYLDLLSKKAELVKQQREKREERERCNRTVEECKSKLANPIEHIPDKNGKFSTVITFSEDLRIEVDGVMDQLRTEYNQHCRGWFNRRKRCGSREEFLRRHEETPSRWERFKTWIGKKLPCFQGLLEADKSDREARNAYVRKASEVQGVWKQWQSYFNAENPVKQLPALERRLDPFRIQSLKYQCPTTNPPFDNADKISKLCAAYQEIEGIAIRSHIQNIQQREREAENAVSDIRKELADLHKQKEGLRKQQKQVCDRQYEVQSTPAPAPTVGVVDVGRGPQMAY